MLTLTRKPGQRIRIGDDIVIEVRKIRGNQVQVGIEAPGELLVYREELIGHASKADRLEAERKKP